MTEIPIKALSTFTEYCGEMRVFNEGDKGSLPETNALARIESGHAERIDGRLVADEPAAVPAAKPAKAAKGPKNPALATARAAYREAFGKNPSPKFDVATIEARIAEKAAADAAASAGSSESDAPPAA